MQRPRAAPDRPGTTRSVLTLAIGIVASGYTVSILALTFLVRELGEHWWLATLLLYAPPHLYAVPLPLVTLCLMGLGLWRWLWTQAVALLIILFATMGLRLPSWSGDDGKRSLKVLSFNVDSARTGVDKIADQVIAIDADIALIQEPIERRRRLAQRLGKHYRHVEVTHEFITASRFPLSAVATTNNEQAARFVEYLVDTPLGKIRLFNIHPVSPRGSMNLYRFREVLGALRSGELFSQEARREIQANSTERMAQLALVAEQTTHSQLPLIVAGDTNSPHPSPVLRESFPELGDGFLEAGSGFGFTYPARLPWLRLDRILASREFVFHGFRVGCHDLSDHLCVIAELSLSKPE